uniref:Protein kinase domain-containing protein n=1 Tax=Macrostomum lignano TaxID=282301 RepID=A0A1I8HVM1_9PLAT
SLQEAAGTTATVSTATAARTPGKPRKRRAPDGGVGGGSGSGGGGGSSVSTAGGIRRIDEFYSANKPLVSLPPPPPPPLSAPTAAASRQHQQLRRRQQQQQWKPKQRRWPVKLGQHRRRKRKTTSGQAKETSATAAADTGNHCFNQERGREVLRALLAEKSRQERRAVRDRCRENRLRLGQFQIVRHGSDLLDKWFDGFAFEEAHRRRQEIEHGKERIEKERRLWMKRKPAAGGTTTKSASSRSTSSAGKHSEVDADEFFTQLEIYDIQRQALVKDEKDLRDEVEKLDRERNVHIREMKRIQNEDSSRFKGNQELHDRYMLLSLLGKGGFSEVHKAYDMTEHRFVACKIHQLSPSWPKEKKDNYIRHAVREIEIHKTLQHPRIVKVYDVFDIDSDCFCTVLEYSKGCDLDFYLKQNKSLPEREARNVICQVVSALKYLNQRRPPVIHYDLKPGNILLGEGDSVADIKLTDFGLSKVMTEDKFQADSGMDLTSQGAGTYWYLPPECFETGPEAPKISSKVDVWSVGVIFYQCLYGQKPFGNNMTQADILRNHTILKALKIDFPQSTPGNCKVSEPAKNFIRRCVTYDKRLRPDVFQLAEDEYLKSKAQLKFDTTTAAYSPAEVGSGGGGSGGSSAWGLMPPPGPV